MRVSKEDRRLAQARRQQRKVKIAKGTIVGAIAVIAPLLMYLTMQA